MNSNNTKGQGITQMKKTMRTKCLFNAHKLYDQPAHGKNCPCVHCPVLIALEIKPHNCTNLNESYTSGSLGVINHSQKYDENQKLVYIVHAIIRATVITG